MFQDLYKWIDSSLEGELPGEIQGFCFNLIENGGSFFVELTGSSEFDEADPDWPCAEVFEAKQRAIEIPEEVSGRHWEYCLESMVKVAKNYLASSSSGALKLNSVKGVGMGFVDGDLLILTKP